MKFEFLGSKGFDRVGAGRKAAALDELASAGFEVPPGFSVPMELDLASVAESDLAEAVARLGGFPVAARSSGALEDMGDASFAGQYVTVLDVADVASLRAAILKCRESADTPQIRAYLQARGIDTAGFKPRMSVLVQRMVRARSAGVLFTLHPLTGREDHMLVESCQGLGERLVSGHTNPTRYVFAHRDGAVIERESGDENVELTAEQLRALADLGLRAQAHFRKPQDVEWAIDESGRVWPLQSRPITRVQWRADLDEFTNADFKDGGVSARVCTPMMYALYRNAMQDSMQDYFETLKLIRRGSKPENWIGYYYGRPYWNASAVKRALGRVPGFDEKQFDADLGIQKDYGAPGPLRTPTNLGTILPVVPVVLALGKEYEAQIRRTEGYGDGFLAEERRFLAETRSMGAMSDARFAEFFAETVAFHKKTESDYFRTIYNNANKQSDFKNLVAKIAKATGEEFSVVALMSGLQGVSHMKIQEGLIALYGVARAGGTESPAFREALARFLDENGFHADAELDLLCPRWSEVPERVLEIVRGFLASSTPPKDPLESARAQNARFLEEKEKVLRALRKKPILRFLHEGGFLKQLEKARVYLLRRETMREYSTRVYRVVRLVVLEAGQRLARMRRTKDAMDIFYLLTEEAQALFAVPDPRIGEEIAHRRLLFAGQTDLVPPDELGRGVLQRTMEKPKPRADGSIVLQGTGCSPGVIEGVVRVVPDLEGTRDLRAGDILVTRFTDPGWTPALGIVSGVVTEVGGMLSHAAVIGREYGIPAVLNLPGATRLLKNGQRVRVDGNAGSVEILAGGSA